MRVFIRLPSIFLNMATIPALIYCTRPPSRAPASINSDEDLLSSKDFGEDNILEESNWGMQPGVWWKDKNKWVMYDKKVTTRITKAAEIGVLKVKFNRAEAAHSLCTSVTGPWRSKHLEIEDVSYHQRSYSSDSSSSSSSVGSPEYEVDLIQMKEVHLQSGIKRDIKIVKASATGCVFRVLSASDNSNADFFIHVKQSTKTSSETLVGEKLRISRKDGIQGWAPYNDDCQRAIWSAWTKGEHIFSIQMKSEKHPNGIHYVIDFTTMQQENVGTGHRRPIQIAMWISSNQFPHMWIGEDSKYLAREMGDVGSAENEIMLHKLALSRLLCPEYVKRAILGNMEPQTLQSLEMSSYEDLAKHGLWNRFLHSFMQTVKGLPDYSGHLWRFALNPDGHHHPENPFAFRNSNNLWRFVFGAPLHGRDSDIWLRSSTKTLASKYHTHIDWFGLTSAITEFHCKPLRNGVVSMLVFLVLMPKNFDDSREKVVFINKFKDPLPVASINVRVDDSTLGPSCSLWEDKIEENTRAWSSEGYQSTASTDTPMWTSTVPVSRRGGSLL